MIRKGPIRILHVRKGNSVRETTNSLLRKIAFLWLGPGGSLVFLDAFAPEIHRSLMRDGPLAWPLLLVLVFLFLHNAIWLAVLCTTIRQRISPRKVPQGVVVAACIAAWAGLAAVLQKILCIAAPCGSG